MSKRLIIAANHHESDIIIEPITVLCGCDIIIAANHCVTVGVSDIIIAANHCVIVKVMSS